MRLATRKVPLFNSSSTVKTASRTCGSALPGVMSVRFSNATSMILCKSLMMVSVFTVVKADILLGKIRRNKKDLQEIAHQPGGVKRCRPNMARRRYTHFLVDGDTRQVLLTSPCAVAWPGGTCLFFSGFVDRHHGRNHASQIRDTCIVGWVSAKKLWW